MTRSKKKGQKKGRHVEIVKPIDESTRIRIVRLLQEFNEGDDKVYTFDAGLTNPERAVVHELCRKMGMTSKSSGKGQQRQVSVFKREIKVNAMKKENTMLTFSEETKEVLVDLFTRYPPNDGELGAEMFGMHNRKFDKMRGKGDDSFCKPSMSKAEIAKKLESLSSRMNKAPNMRQIAEVRSKLPIASFKEVITSALESHQVVLISGETGCGKTTQVPQFILDYMWGKGETCKIICTQPRRISAISVAERISYERGENVGDSVGYKIRFETKGGKQSSILFCTNGVLLRILVANGTGSSNSAAGKESLKDRISEISHLIVDEIHERDRYSDIMLAILRDMLTLYPRLRLILMSATLDAERFSQYFGGCHIIRVPGFTYPVTSFYLEDVLSILKSSEDKNYCPLNNTVEDFELTDEYRVALDDAIDLALSSDEFETILELISSQSNPKIYNYQHSSTGASPLMVFSGKGRVGDVCMLLSLGADCHLCCKDGTTALDWAKRESHEEVVEIIKQHMDGCLSNTAEEQKLLEKYLATVDPEHIDISLIVKLLRKICIDSNEGAILVFLPGWDEIKKTRERLLPSPFFQDPSKFVIIALHSMVPSVEQKKVFNRPPPGCRKIVLSTNIAETAVTIDDVVYVIDSGRMKEKNYDPFNNISTLTSSWVSKASAKQREGRAGRCLPGVCYHLYSRTRAASLSDFQVPEIKRMPMEEICLQVKMLDPDCKLVDFLQKTLDPPVPETVRNAITVLQGIGALIYDEKLSELGEKLGSLPVHPLTSKMLFFAILMNCLDPALTIACASDFKDPFILPMAPEEKKKAAAAKAELASLYGGHSDQLMIIAAFDSWRRAKDRGQESRFCSQYFLSSSTMNMLSRLRIQLQKELIRHGFISEDVSNCSLNARDPGIVSAVLVAGMYPMVGKLQVSKKGGKKRFVETASGITVVLHSHSCTYKLTLKSENNPLCIYDEITRGDGGMFIRNCSLVGPYPFLLLAKEIGVAPAKGNEDKESVDDDDEDGSESGSDEDGMDMDGLPSGKREGRIMSSPDNIVSVVIDRWLTFESRALDVAQLYCLRERLSAAILFKVKNPGMVLPPALGASIKAIACFLSYDGLSGISVPEKYVDSLKSMSQEKDTQLPGNSSNSFLRSLMNDENHENSSSYYRKPKELVSNVTQWNNGSGSHYAEPSFTPVGINQRQRPPLVGGGSGVTGSKGNPKRRRR